MFWIIGLIMIGATIFSKWVSTSAIAELAMPITSFFLSLAILLIPGGIILYVWDRTRNIEVSIVLASISLTLLHFGGMV